MSATDDPRWARLLAAGGLDEIRFEAPEAWPHGPRGDAKTLTVGDDSLSENYCTLAGHRFLRARLVLPVKARQAVLGLEVWASVSEATYAAVMAARMGGAPFAGGFAWAANTLPGFASPEPLACNLLPAARPGQIPRLYAQSGPLKEAQGEGLDLDALEAVLSAAGRALG